MNDTFILGIIGAGLVLTVVIIASTVNTINELKIDIKKMSGTLNKIAAQVGVPCETVVPNTITDELMDELKSLIFQGKKIKAIKAYRVATGIGLKQAKDYVDALCNQKLK